MAMPEDNTPAIQLNESQTAVLDILRTLPASSNATIFGPRKCGLSTMARTLAGERRDVAVDDWDGNCTSAESRACVHWNQAAAQSGAGLVSFFTPSPHLGANPVLRTRTGTTQTIQVPISGEMKFVVSIEAPPTAVLPTTIVTEETSE